MLGDWVHQFATATGVVLEAGRRVVVYSGKEDYICNYIGGEEWTNVTQWKQQVREREKERERERERERSVIVYWLIAEVIYMVVVDIIVMRSFPICGVSTYVL